MSVAAILPDGDGSVSSTLLAAGQEISTRKVGGDCRGRPTGNEEIGEMGERRDYLVGSIR